MPKNYIGVFVRLLVLALVFFAVHFAVLHFTALKSSLPYFTYPLAAVYGFFFAFSAVILLVLYIISDKNAAQTGYAFLGLTAVKLAAAWFFAKPILDKTPPAKAEKINFFIVFLLFLAIEAFYTARLLNKKQ